MRQGRVDLVVVGADRIAANGDTANKIGTYGVAVLAREHQVPFYVAAPLSTIDLNTPDGQHIPIEERNAREVTHVGAVELTPEGALVWNPVVRRHAASLHCRHHHRARHLPRPRIAESLSCARSRRQPANDCQRSIRERDSRTMLMLWASKRRATRPRPPWSRRPATPRVRGRFGRTSSRRRSRFIASGAASCRSSPRASTSAISAASSSARSRKRASPGPISERSPSPRAPASSARCSSACRSRRPRPLSPDSRSSPCIIWPGISNRWSWRTASCRCRRWCSSCRADTRACTWWSIPGRISSSAAPATMRRGRRTTRWRSCSVSGIRADRSSIVSPATATTARSSCRPPA